MNPYVVANELGRIMKEILLPEARIAHADGEIEKRDRLLDQADAVLERIVDSMPPDPRTRA